jgi:cyclase
MDELESYGLQHFKLHPLAEGVYAAIAENGGQAISNAGLVGLGGQVIIFDTFLTPQAAVELRRFAIDRFGQVPHIIINSHYHNDHIWGNQVFAPDGLILSSAATRQLIATAGMEEFEWFRSNSAQKLESLRTEYQNSTDEQRKNEILLWIGEYGGIVEALPQLSVRMPAITFPASLELHGNKRTARLITYEGGHTGSDTILHLPGEGIIFMSDLLFVSCHPYLADGDPAMLLKALKEISLLDASLYVPGHGPVGTTTDLKMLIEYIELCYATARKLVVDGNVREEQIAELKVEEKYRTWLLPRFYQFNIRFLCQRLSTADGTDQP